MKSLDRQKLLIGGLALAGVLVLVLGYMAVISPQSTKAKSLDGDLASAQQRYQSLHDVKMRPASLRAAELFQLSRAMPDNDDMAGILLELSHLSDVSKMKLTALTPQPRIALPDGSSAVPLRVTLTGSWAQLAEFLRLVSNQVKVGPKTLSVAGRLFAVDNISVAPGENATDIFATVNMNAFDYGAPLSPTATAGAANTSTSTTTTTTTPSASGTQQAAGTGNGA